jgi:hypothetical protein
VSCTGVRASALSGLLSVVACAGQNTLPNDPPAANSCLDGITSYAEAGPFAYEMQTAGMLQLWVPAVPTGCKVPVVHLANGTQSKCGSYQGVLQRLASHGFLAVCYEDPNTGAGSYGLTAFETALEMLPNLADKKLGSTGHSQGGQAALISLQLAEEKFGDEMIYAGLAIEPASGYGAQPVGQTWQEAYAKIRSPVFMFSGDAGSGYVNAELGSKEVGDGLVAVRWVEEAYDTLSDDIEAYHWTAAGAGHVPAPIAYAQLISIPWFRWKLLGDNAACKFFESMPRASRWVVQAEQNAAPCE